MKLNLSDNALKILKKRYLEPGETPEQRYKSMADKIASAEETNKEKWANEFYRLFAEQKVLPNSPTIMNYGKPDRQQQGSACFVLPIKDDLNDIFDTIRKAALIHKSGGGTGYNFSSLRCNGAIVKTTGKSSSGVIPFLKAYDACTGAVSQGGTRRGANMGILNVSHPDIIDFIYCKSEDNTISNFNLSVGVTERFFEAVKNNENWELCFLDENGQKMPFYPTETHKQWSVNPLLDVETESNFIPDNGVNSFGKYDTYIKSGAVTEVVVSAKRLYDAVVEHAHKNGEPGIIFVDRLQKANSVPSEPIDATNPCGEQPLPPDNSCVLASQNLANHMKEDWSDIDYVELDNTIMITVRMLDDIVTVNEYPIQEIKEGHDKQRRIGLGITGLADALIMMGIPYGSEEGRKKAGEIMEFINDRSHYWSYQLGKEKGSFPLFSASKFNANGRYRDEALKFYKSFLANPKYDKFLSNNDYAEYNIYETYSNSGFMRNAATTTIAPTGTLTSLLECEGYGGEPLFAIGYMRFILNGEKLPYVSNLFSTIAKKFGFYSEELINKAAECGNAQFDEVPLKWRDVFRTANEISVHDHILMQAELQKYCDSGISKTINMTSSATVKDVDDAYQLAYYTGVIKGLTVYRDKSRDSAPIQIGTTENKEESNELQLSIEQLDKVDKESVKKLNEIANKIKDKSDEIEFDDEYIHDEDDEDVIEEVAPIKRPKVTEGTTTKYNTGCGKMYFTVNHDDESIIETFAFTGSSGGCSGLTEGLSRMISLTIRLIRGFADSLGLDTDKVVDSAMVEIIDQLRSVRCNVALRNRNAEGKSCPDIMGKALDAAYNKFKSDKSKSVIEQTKLAIESGKDVNGCANCPNKTECKVEDDYINKVIISTEFDKEFKEAIANTFACPDCGAKMVKNEGCAICPNCGYSKCN
jgi:ribonucleoside-diphosphate reductase alpha chain